MRERAYRNIIAFSTKTAPIEFNGKSQLVTGSVVVSIDYFKRVAAGLRSLFGGRIGAYESLVERARREALLRMKEDAKSKGSKMIINVKLETASISKNAQQGVGAVEVIAYGTALSTEVSV